MFISRGSENHTKLRLISIFFNCVAYIVCIDALHVASSYHTSTNVIQNNYQRFKKIRLLMECRACFTAWLIEIARIRGKSHFLRILSS